MKKFMLEFPDMSEYDYFDCVHLIKCLNKYLERPPHVKCKELDEREMVKPKNKYKCVCRGTFSSAFLVDELVNPVNSVAEAEKDAEEIFLDELEEAEDLLPYVEKIGCICSPCRKGDQQCKVLEEDEE